MGKGYSSPPALDTSAYDAAYKSTQDQLSAYQTKLSELTSSTDAFVASATPEVATSTAINWEEKINQLNEAAAAGFTVDQSGTKNRADTVKAGTLLDDTEVPTGTSLLTGK